MRIERFAAGLAVLAALLLGGCAAPASAEIYIENAAGNTPFNIMGGGKIAAQDDFLYYYETANRCNAGEGLYCSRRNGEEKRKLASGAVSSVNALGDGVYYVQAGQDGAGALWRVSSAGGAAERLLEGCAKVYVAGGDLYYIGDGRLYRRGIDGGESVELAAGGVIDYFVEGSSIWYRTQDGVYSPDAAGGPPARLVKGTVDAFCVQGGALYYAVYDQTTGTTAVTIREPGGATPGFHLGGRLQRLVVYKGKLFLYTDKGDLLRADRDGSHPVVYSVGEPLELCFFEDRAYAWTAAKALCVLDDSVLSHNQIDVLAPADALATPSLTVKIDSVDSLVQVVADYGLENADGSGTILTDTYSSAYFADKALILALVRAKPGSSCELMRLAYDGIKTSGDPDLALEVGLGGFVPAGEGEPADCIGFLIEVDRVDARYTQEVCIVIDHAGQGQ